MATEVSENINSVEVGVGGVRYTKEEDGTRITSVYSGLEQKGIHITTSPDGITTTNCISPSDYAIGGEIATASWVNKKLRSQNDTIVEVNNNANNRVLKTGDTITGQLTLLSNVSERLVFKSNYTWESVNSEVYSEFLVKDSNNNRIGGLRFSCTPRFDDDGNKIQPSKHISLYCCDENDTNKGGIDVKYDYNDNTVFVTVPTPPMNSNHDRAVTSKWVNQRITDLGLSNDVSKLTNYDKVLLKTGGTATGHIKLVNSSMISQSTTLELGNTSGGHTCASILDKNDNTIGYFASNVDSNLSSLTRIVCRNPDVSDIKETYLGLVYPKTGTPYAQAPNPDNGTNGQKIATTNWVNDKFSTTLSNGGLIPSGLISLWYGSVSNIPNGWVLCNGQNGTPDLRDKFVVGAGNTYNVSATGGESTHTLTTSEMPSHTHDKGTYEITGEFGANETGSDYASGAFYVKDTNNRIGSGDSDRDNDTIVFEASRTWEGDSGPTGGGQPHNNMPPYYALCYIMKL